MNRRQRLNYIFSTQRTGPIRNRFAWLDTALLGDIQTFVDGVNDFVKMKRRPTATIPRGGGNTSIPILTSTGLELVSALYVGATKYGKKSHYNAEGNVSQFVQRYFPGNSAKLPHILWDGTRNGLTHVFTPKVMRRRKDYFQFTYFVDDRSVSSAIKRNGGVIVIWFNSIEYYRILKKAISNYKSDLRKDRRLQLNFIRAWKSIEHHVRNLDDDQLKKPEADFIRHGLRKKQVLSLFR